MWGSVRRQEDSTSQCWGGGGVGTVRDYLDIIISVNNACVPTPVIHCSEPVTPGQWPQYVIWQDTSALCFTKKRSYFAKQRSAETSLLFYCMYLLTSHKDTVFLPHQLQFGVPYILEYKESPQPFQTNMIHRTSSSILSSSHIHDEGSDPIVWWLCDWGQVIYPL